MIEHKSYIDGDCRVVEFPEHEGNLSYMRMGERHLYIGARYDCLTISLTPERAFFVADLLVGWATRTNKEASNANP